MLNEVAYFTNYTAEWKGLKKIFAVKREVEKDGEKTEEILFNRKKANNQITHV